MAVCPFILEKMTEEEYAAYEARRDEERRWLLAPIAPTQPQPQYPTTIGQRLLRLRRELGWTQAQAAAHLGVSRRTIIRHERGPSGRAPGLWRLWELERQFAQRLSSVEPRAFTGGPPYSTWR